MKIHDLEQQSEEWFKIKELKLSSSEATAIGNNNKGLDSLARQLVREHLAGRKNFTNNHLDRGNEYEPIARELYELETGRKIVKVGFIELDERVGCSTDGLIDEDGIAEIKSPDDPAYFDLLIDMKVDSGYMWQAQMEILVTKRKWVDLIYYNPNFSKNMVIFRIYPDPVMQEKLLIGIESGKKLIDKYLLLYEERSRETDSRVIGQESGEKKVKVFEGECFKRRT